jgi:hypothetical protein
LRSRTTAYSDLIGLRVASRWGKARAFQYGVQFFLFYFSARVIAAAGLTGLCDFGEVHINSPIRYLSWNFFYYSTLHMLFQDKKMHRA